MFVKNKKHWQNKKLKSVFFYFEKKHAFYLNIKAPNVFIMLYIYADCMTNAFERLSSVRHVQKLLQ